MFLRSKLLCERIQEIAAKAAAISEGVLLFEEFIALPHYGSVILRFDLKKEQYSLDEVDRYENLLRSLVGEDFLIDFMGSVYRKLGIEPQKLPSILEELYDSYREEPIFPLAYAQEIREDAKGLLHFCGLGEDLPVWEIQPEEGEILLLLLAEENGEPHTVTKDGSCVHVMEVEQRSCRSLMGAAFYARRKNISLLRALLQA